MWCEQEVIYKEGDMHTLLMCVHEHFCRISRRHLATTPSLVAIAIRFIDNKFTSINCVLLRVRTSVLATRLLRLLHKRPYCTLYGCMASN